MVLKGPIRAKDRAKSSKGGRKMLGNKIFSRSLVARLESHLSRGNARKKKKIEC